MSSSRKRRDIFCEINITPLTDIFLVLLIIMMVIAPMLDSQGLKLAVPTLGASKEVSEDPKAISLKITTGGQYQINNQTVSLDALQQQLFKNKANYPDGLIIEPQATAKHGAVVAAMDAARSAGIDKIAVIQAQE